MSIPCFSDETSELPCHFGSRKPLFPKAAPRKKVYGRFRSTRASSLSPGDRQRPCANHLFYGVIVLPRNVTPTLASEHGCIRITLHGIPAMLRYALGKAIGEFGETRRLLLDDDASPLAEDENEAAHVAIVLASHHAESNTLELKRILRRFPRAHVLVMALRPDDSGAARLIRSGARGYMALNEPASEWITAIAELAAGRLFVPRSLQQSFAIRYLSPATDAPEDRLSVRELSVLRLLAEGMRNDEIAASLFISIKTVDTHRMNLMRKLALRTNVDIVRFAIRRGLVEL